MPELTPPEYGIGVDKGPDGKHFITLEVRTGFTKHTFFIGNAASYVNNAQVFHENIMKAGKECARLDSGLVTMNANGGDLDAIIQAQGRKPRTPGRSRP